MSLEPSSKEDSPIHKLESGDCEEGISSTMEADEADCHRARTPTINIIECSSFHSPPTEQPSERHFAAHIDMLIKNTKRPESYTSFCQSVSWRAGVTHLTLGTGSVHFQRVNRTGFLKLKV